MREHVVRRPSPAALSASEAAVAAAAAAASRGARALRRAAGVLASAGAAADTVFSGAMDIGVGVGVSRIHRLCGLRRRRGGHRRCRRPSPLAAHLWQHVHYRHRADQVQHAARGPRGDQRGGQANDVPALFTPSGWR